MSCASVCLLKQSWMQNNEENRLKIDLKPQKGMTKFRDKIVFFFVEYLYCACNRNKGNLRGAFECDIRCKKKKLDFFSSSNAVSDDIFT